jgi:hypothetical protein
MADRPDGSQRKCPFYGFHWPERGTSLQWSGGSECGLDLDHHGPCQMEQQHDEVDFQRCPRRLTSKNLLDAGKLHIRFYSPELPPDGLPLETWSALVRDRE